MPTAVITGANSGIGHAFAQILVKEGYKVVAADVNIDGPIKELQCEAIKLDISSTDDIAAFKPKIGNQTKCSGAPRNRHPRNRQPRQLPKDLRSQHFRPYPRHSIPSPQHLASQHSKIAVVSSRVGSMGSGGAYSYRSSKAAVNALFKSIRVDLEEKNVPVIILHPGIVKTNLDPRSKEGKSEVQGVVLPEQAAGELWKVLKSKGLESTGKFYHRSGEELPW